VIALIPFTSLIFIINFLGKHSSSYRNKIVDDQ